MKKKKTLASILLIPLLILGAVRITTEVPDKNMVAYAEVDAYNAVEERQRILNEINNYQSKDFIMTHENTRVEALAGIYKEKIEEIIKEAQETAGEIINAETAETNGDYSKEHVEAVRAYMSQYVNMDTIPVQPEYFIELANEKQMDLKMVIGVGLLESHWGTAGRGADTRNMMNVGNYDCGDGKATSSTDGCSTFFDDSHNNLNIWADYMAGCYFNEGEDVALTTWMERDFRIVRSGHRLCNGLEGKRYMTDVNSYNKYSWVIRQLAFIDQIPMTK